MKKFNIKSLMKTIKNRRLLVSAGVVLLLALFFFLSSSEKAYKRHADFGTACEDIHKRTGAKAKCVSLYFGTTRDPRASLKSAEGGYEIINGFGNKFDGQLHLGQAQVTMPYLVSDLYPEGRKRGVVDHAINGAPEGKAQTERYVSITTISKTEMRKSFATNLSEAVLENNDAVLLFIHGFNVDFDSAVVRAAQLAIDLGFDENAPPDQTYYAFGQPVLFSWPNGGVPFTYVDDRRLAKKSAAHLKEFLALLTEETGTGALNVVVHSMGNRVFVNAITEFAKSYAQTGGGDVVIRIIHAAADVDQEIYDATMDEVERTAFEADYTVYASREDTALETSTRVNALTSLFENKSGRLGEIGDEGIYVRPTITSIDATGFATDLFGHGYFSNAGNIINDIACIFHGVGLSKRALAPRRNGDLPYYEMDSSKYAICLPGDLKRYAADAARYSAAHAEAVAEAKAVGVYDSMRSAVGNSAGSIWDLQCLGELDESGQCVDGAGGEVEPVPAPDPTPAPDSIELTIYFLFSETVLSADEQQKLDEVLKAISGKDIESILVEGHTDRAGGDAFNQRLSLLRADAVREYLMVGGVAREQIFIRGFGETAPARPTTDGERNLLNRRTRVLVLFR